MKKTLLLLSTLLPVLAAAIDPAFYGNGVGLTNEPATGINFTTNGVLNITNTVVSSSTDTNNVTTFTSTNVSVLQATNGSIYLPANSYTNITTTTNAIVTGTAGTVAFSLSTFLLEQGVSGLAYSANGTASATTITNLGAFWQMKQAANVRYSNNSPDITSTWFVGNGVGPAPTVIYKATTNIFPVNGTYNAPTNTYGVATLQQPDPLTLENYPMYGNVKLSEAFITAYPIFVDPTGCGVVRNIWFTSYTSLVTDSSWFNRTNVELRIYTDFGTNFTAGGGTNPSLTYLNFRAPVSVMMGDNYRPTNILYVATKDTRYLRTIDDNSTNNSSYYSFGLNMPAPYSNGCFISLWDNKAQVNVSQGFGMVSYQNQPQGLPYSNWRLRSFATNGVWGDTNQSGPVTNGGSSIPIISQASGPGMICGFMLSMKRDPANALIFEGSTALMYPNGESWIWHGNEDLFGFAWEMQAGGYSGLTNLTSGFGIPPLTNTAPILIPNTQRDYGLNYYEGAGANAAVEAYRFFGPDAIVWTNGVTGYFTFDHTAGGGIQTNVLGSFLTIYYAP